MVQPIRQKLRRDAKRRPVLHEADVLQVWHLRAADAEIHPAHNIAEDGLSTLAQLLLDVVRVELDLEQRWLQDQVHRGGRAHGQLHLTLRHLDAVVVDAVESSRQGRWNPSSARACHRFSDLGLEHGQHAVGLGPHSLADLSPALEIGVQADVDVGVLVGLDPGLLLHVGLADHGPGHHAGVDLVAGAVEEAGVDEEDARGGGSDALAQVDTGAALLVHDAHLDGVPAQAEELLGTPEERVREGDLARAMHLGLDDVHRAQPAVHHQARAAEVLQGSGRGHEAVHEALGHRAAVTEHHVREHVVADVSHQAHGAARQRLGVALLVAQPDVGPRAAYQGLAVLHEGCLEGAPHDAADVGVDLSLVVGIHRRDGVLHIQDRSQCGLHGDVLDAAEGGFADGVLVVDLQDEVQTVVFQEDAPLVRQRRRRDVGRDGHRHRGAGAVRAGRAKAANGAHEEGGRLEARRLTGFQQQHQLLLLAHELRPKSRDLGPAAGRQRRDLIQQAVGELDHSLATHGIVARHRGRRRAYCSNIETGSGGAELNGRGGDDVETVQSVEERAPARIDSVEHVARIVRWHDELWGRDQCDFWVDELGADAHRASVILQVADLLQECLALRPKLLRGTIGTRRLAPFVESVNLFLELVAALETGLHLGAELLRKLLEAGPEVGRTEAGAWADLHLHHLDERRVDLERAMAHIPLGCGDRRRHRADGAERESWGGCGGCCEGSPLVLS
mmetsp:Transcript_108186/g.286687  ORF Transcript_108186/g.286687 Transcript_108186/m.286687 type:complete len:731 (-) Transcript_108186:3-2195(-)